MNEMKGSERRGSPTPMARCNPIRPQWSWLDGDNPMNPAGERWPTGCAHSNHGRPGVESTRWLPRRSVSFINQPKQPQGEPT